MTHALQDIRAIQTGGGHADEHFAVAGFGRRSLGDAEHLRPAILFNLNCAHDRQPTFVIMAQPVIRP